MISQEFTIDIKSPTDSVISFYKGDTHSVTFTFKNDSAVFDLSGYTIILSAKKLLSSATPDMVVSGANVITTNAASGIIVFNFDPIHTSTLTANESYFYDIQATLGSTVYTIAFNRIELLQDISDGTIPVPNPIDNYIYLVGDILTDGSWRIRALQSSNLLVQYRASGTWTTKGEFTI